jgi:electron transfer flavoprotein alpha subunit
MSVLILIVAEHDNQSIRPATLNAIAASSRLDGEVHLLVAGSSARPAADAAAQITGVSKVLLVDGKQLEHGLAEDVAAQVVAVATAYSHIVFASTAWGKNIAPRVAALLDVAQISDVMNIIDHETVRSGGARQPTATGRRARCTRRPSLSRPQAVGAFRSSEPARRR